MIIGLAGKKGSGKDTVADYLVNNYDFVKYGFGDPIKEVARIMFGFTDDQLYGESKEKLDDRWGIKPREFFQKFGTEYGQIILPQHFPNCFHDINSKQFWVKCFWFWYVKEKKNNPQIKVVISDVRFRHELNFLKEKEAYILKIKRNTGYEDSHVSENEIDEILDFEFHGILNNDGSKEELFKEIRNILN